MPFQKLLFSATLTQNPEKIQELGLYQPRLFSTGLESQGSPTQPGTEQDGQGKYAFPAGLSVRARGRKEGAEAARLARPRGERERSLSSFRSLMWKSGC